MPDKVPYATPAVRAFARELGVDLARVTGSERGGRITKEDVQKFVKELNELLGPEQGWGMTGLFALSRIVGDHSKLESQRQ